MKKEIFVCRRLLSWLEIIMNNFDKLKDKNLIDHNYDLYNKIIYVVKIIKKIFKTHSIDVTIAKRTQTEVVQKKNINVSNNLFSKFRKSRYFFEKYKEKIFYSTFYEKNK
jgi:hypothetical protein